MVSAKPWRADATVRLIMSVFVCVFAGSVAGIIANIFRQGSFQTSILPLVLGVLSLASLAATVYLVNKPMPLEAGSRPIIMVLLTFYLGMATGAYAHHVVGPREVTSVQIIIGALSFQGAGLILVWKFLQHHAMTWNEAFGFSTRWPRAVLIGGFAAVLFLPVGWGLQHASARVLDHIPGLHATEQETVRVLREAMGWSRRLVLGLVTIVLAPVAEEVLFRGIMYPWLKSYGFHRAALWGTALFFAVIHFNMVTLVPLLLLAIVLTWLYELSGNLLAPIAAHSLFNAFNFAVLYALER
jgi:membrane protease YdiL (CAAX protease family)